MKVLTIVRDLGLRGTQRAAATYSKAYAAQGWDVKILTRYPDRSRAQDVEANGAQLLPLDLTDAIRQATSFSPDLIHIHRKGCFNETESRIIRTIKKKNTLVIETNVFGLVDYSKYRAGVDIHTHVSAWSLSRWNQWKGSRDMIGAFLPNPIETAEFYPISKKQKSVARERFGLPRNAYVLGNVGYKLSTAVIEAFRKLSAEENAWLICCPGDIKAVEKIKTQLSVETQKRVIFTGEITASRDLRDVYGTMDCFIHAPEHGETFGYVCAEASLCGLPCITLATPHKDNAQTEIIMHLNTGIVTANPQAFSSACDQLFRHPELRQRLGKLGRARTIENYGTETVLRNLNRLIANCHKMPTNRRKLLIETDPYLVTTMPKGYHRRVSATGHYGSPRMCKNWEKNFFQNQIGQRLHRMLRYREFGKSLRD